MNPDPYNYYQSEYLRKMFMNAEYGKSAGPTAYTYHKAQGQPGYESPTATHITKQKPREGFIDAGVILKKGETISYTDFVNMPTDEWNELQNLVETLANIEVDEILEKKVLWIYNTVPCITSMAA